MTAVPEAVWITLMGEHFHAVDSCQGIADGHAKALREGKRRWEAEEWPVRLASSGWPRALGRGACAVCLPDATLPVGGQDDAGKVERSKGGKIAEALGNSAIRRDRARGAEWRAAAQDHEAHLDSAVSSSGSDFELAAMREAMTPIDADYTAEDR